MNNFQSALVLSIWATASTAMAGDGQKADETLCAPHEDIYFSCKLQDTEKMVSVCASKNDTPDTGYVQYRYGNKSKLDFLYPKEKIPPRNKFSFVDVSRLAEGRGSHLKFSSGNFKYIVSNALAPGEIYVVKGDKKVFDKVCAGSEYMPFPYKAEHGIQYGVEEKVDALDNH